MARIFPVAFFLAWFSLGPTSSFAAKPEPWLLWQAADERSVESINHSLWQDFLDVAVVRDKARQLNLLRYRALTDKQLALLSEYLVWLQSIDPRDYNRAEQMAYWINLYNALTVKVVLDNPDENSIRDMGSGWFSSGPWRDQLAVVAGQSLTLDDIEHRILRPLWQNPRIHYAVNCASISCPELAASAYTGANLEVSMNAAESTYIRHPRGVAFNEQGELLLSSLYEWYLQDFAEDEDGLLEYLANHSDPAQALRLRGYAGKIRYSYDWSLNSAN
jgi:hypothetical protein